MTLPKLNSVHDCPKCGKVTGDASYTYHPPGTLIPAVHGDDTRGECIIRVCARCGYGWAEAPADSWTEPPLPKADPSYVQTCEGHHPLAEDIDDDSYGATVMRHSYPGDVMGSAHYHLNAHMVFVEEFDA